MPKNDLVQRIDQRPRPGGTRGTGIVPSGTGVDDSHLVRRDGTHTLYALAQWLWESGAEVNATLRSWGSGLLQVFGQLYAGRREGPRVGMAQYTVTDSYNAVVVEVVGSDNVPVFSAGALDTSDPTLADPNDAWVNIGREGFPRISMGALAGYDRDVPLVPAVLITGQLTPEQVDLAGLNPIPIVNALTGLSYSEGQLFLLRAGGDSGVLYMWTRWGPEPVGGYHAAGPHTHAAFDEGAQVRLDTALEDVTVTDASDSDLLVYDSASGTWQNGRVLGLGLTVNGDSADSDTYLKSLSFDALHVDAGSNALHIMKGAGYLGFFAATPIEQPTAAGAYLGFTQSSGYIVNDVSTFTGNVGSTAYTIGDVVAGLKNIGLLEA